MSNMTLKRKLKNLDKCLVMITLSVSFATMFISIKYFGKAQNTRLIVLDPTHMKTSNSLVLMLESVSNGLELENWSKDRLQTFRVKTTEILNKLDHLLKHQNKSEKVDVLDVCPEKNPGQKGHAPFYMEGHMTMSCQNAKALEDVISIILIYRKPSKYLIKMFPKVLEGINKTYPSVRVFLGTDESVLIDQAEGFQHTKVVKTRSKDEYGKVLLKILLKVRTPYVLLARGLFFFNEFSNLERQIRMIAQDENIVAVGGAFRNTTAHWKTGCHQSETKMRVLKYFAGYYKSQSECLYCDMLTSSFVARTKTVNNLTFDPNLDEEFSFRDWFLKVQLKGHKVMTCPDVMYFMSDEKELGAISRKDLWQPFAQKWEFDYIRPDHVTIIKFSCEEIKFECNMMTTKSTILPTCCFDQMAKAFQFWVEFSAKYNISYELQSGSVMAAVKLGNMMPWDLDGDMDVKSKFIPFIFNLKDEFKNHGLRTFRWQSAHCCDKNGDHIGGKFLLNEPLYIEMFGEPKMSTELYLPKELGREPTKLTLHGVTLNGPVNPGLYVRNKYGVECYRHAQSWILTRMKDSHQQYKSGFFRECEKPGFHACLDLHPTDGSIPFNIDI